MPETNTLYEKGEKEINPSTPVNISKLGRALRNHPNRCFVNYLITGLVQGFFAGLSWMPDYSLVCKNLLSALKEPEVVDSLLEKEVKKGFMIGPFDDPPFPTIELIR